MITRTPDERVDNTGITLAKPFWSGITTIPLTTNSYGEALYTGSFEVDDNITNPQFDGYCNMTLEQTASVVGHANYHYVALRETQYQLPLFRAEDTKIYMPLSIVFDWAGDADSFTAMELFSVDAQSDIYIKIIFHGTSATTYVNGDQKANVNIDGFYMAPQTTKKLGLRVISQNMTGYVERGSSVSGNLQIALTDVSNGITRILHQGTYTVNPFRLYQFEAKLAHA